MTQSLIKQFITEHPQNWEALLTEKKIKIKHDGASAIFNYDVGADFSDPIVREARGIIIDIPTGKILCWPFEKFFNWGEPNAAEIDWNTARVQEKIDGSIIKMWHDNGWNISTMATIDADKADINGTSVTFGSVMRGLGFTNQNGIGKNLDEDLTYMFELVSPYNQVVIRYDKPQIFHIGTKNRITGEELDVDIGITKPKEFPLKTLYDCILAVAKLNEDKRIIRHEGFVVVDSDWNRLKIKSPDYLVAHRLKGNGNVSKDYIVGLLKSLSAEEVDKICEQNLDQARFFRYYQWQLEELKHSARYMVDYARALLTENDNSRKAVALNIKDSRYAMIGFASLNNELTAEEILSNIKIEKLISDYQEESE